MLPESATVAASQAVVASEVEAIGAVSSIPASTILKGLGGIVAIGGIAAAMSSGGGSSSTHTNTTKPKPNTDTKPVEPNTKPVDPNTDKPNEENNNPDNFKFLSIADDINDAKQLTDESESVQILGKLNAELDAGKGSDVAIFTNQENHTTISAQHLKNFEVIQLSGVGVEKNLHVTGITAENVLNNVDTTVPWIQNKNGETLPQGLFILGKDSDSVDLGAAGGSLQDPNGQMWHKLLISLIFMSMMQEQIP